MAWVLEQGVCSLHMATAWLYPHVETLTFLLPSVTTRGTGMGGHLLRWGGGFSLFHKMIICKGTEWLVYGIKHSTERTNYVFWKQLVYLWAVFGLGHHLQELHNWLRLGNQRRCGMDDGSKFLARHDSCNNGRFGELEIATENWDFGHGYRWMVNSECLSITSVMFWFD